MLPFSNYKRERFLNKICGKRKMDYLENLFAVVAVAGAAGYVINYLRRKIEMRKCGDYKRYVTEFLPGIAKNRIKEEKGLNLDFVSLIDEAVVERFLESNPGKKEHWVNKLEYQKAIYRAATQRRKPYIEATYEVIQ